MKIRPVMVVAAGLFLTVAAFSQRLPQTVDGGARRGIETYVRQMAESNLPTRIVCPASNAWYVSSDLYGPLWFGADLLNANGEGPWRIVFENNARWNIVASEAAALEGGEQDPVALSMGYQNADGVQAQIGLAILSAGQISNPEWWGFLTSESDPVAMSQGFVTGAPWQSEGYLTSLSGHGTSELNNDSGFIAVSADMFGLGSGFNIYGYAYGTEGRIPDYEQDRVAMSQGFVTGAPWQSEGYLTSLSGHGTSELNNDSGFIAVSGDQFGLGSGFNIYGYAYGTEGRIPDYEQDRVAMSQGFVTANFSGGMDGDLVTVAGGGTSLSSMEPTTWLASHENDPLAMSAGFMPASSLQTELSALGYPAAGDVCFVQNGQVNAVSFNWPSAYEFDPVAMAAGFITGADVPNYESDPVAMSQGFVSFAGGTEGDLVVVSGGGLGTADPGTTIAAFASAQGFLTSESDPVAMAQGFLTSVPWDASVAYASEAGYAGSANSAYSAEECSSWGGWSHVAIQGNGGQPTVGDMLFMSDGGLTMLNQYNISTPNPPVFLGSEWHDGVGNMPKWLLQSEMQAGYATISGSTSNVVSGVGHTFSLTNAFAGVTQVVVFADGVVTNRFKLP